MRLKMGVRSTSAAPGLRRRAPIVGAWLATLSGFAMAAAPLGGQERPVAPEDYYRLVSVRSVALAPGADRVAFTVARIDEERNERVSTVWLQELRDGEPVGEPFRFSSPTHEASSPVWSPDGSLLAFTSRRGSDPNPTWFLRTTGPGGEAFHIEGVRDEPIWSPDGRWIAFIAAPEREGEQARSGDGASRAGWISPAAISRPADPERFDGRVITHLNHRQDGSPDPLPHPSATPPDQLFVVPATGGEPIQLTRFAHSVRRAIWSRDGRALYVTVDESDGEDVRPRSRVHIFRIPREGGTARRLTDGEARHSALALSPDGRSLVYRYSRRYGAPTDLFLVNLDEQGMPSGERRNLTADWPLVPGAPAWTANGRALRFDARVGGSGHLFELAIETGKIRQVTSGARELESFSFSRDGDWMAYTATSPLHPTEVFVARSDGRAERRVTSFHDAWLATVHLQPPERLTWTVSDGTEIEGWILPPTNREPGRTYPMVLVIHGGPHAAYGNRFSEQFQMLSGAGFYVLYSNPRGSTGYGEDFTWAIMDGWGATDEEDLVRGVETALARYPDIDPSRLGVTGWSYGGFMTNWLTARTDLFAAAVTGASVVDWESDAGTTDIWYTIHYEFGPLWEAREVYRALSPLSYVENVSAPTLILHGEHDVRVPYKNAEQWFRVLNMRGVPVELVRYPDTGHTLGPWDAVDRLERTRSWFVHWLVEVPLASRASK